MKQIYLALGLVALLAILFLTSITAFLRIAQLDDPFTNPNAGIFLYLLGYTLIAYALIISVGINKFGKKSLRELGWKFEKWPKNIALGAGGAIVAVFALFLMGKLLGSWTTQEFLEMQARFVGYHRLLFFAIGLNAAFIEESLFRGFLQPALTQKLGKIPGILLGSTIFSLYHLPFQLHAFLGKFIIGLVLGTLVQRQKSLLPAAVAHILIWLMLGAI